MVDEEVVVDRLELINTYTNECKEMRNVPKDEYLEDIVLQRAVERSLMNAIQSCIDLASHLRAAEDLGSAETSREEIEALDEADIISTEMGSKLVEAVGFRNHLPIDTAISTTILFMTCYKTISSGSTGSSRKSQRGFAIDDRS